MKPKSKMHMVPEEPTMSDTTILVTVEDLINRAMGPPNANVVDFKLVQMILEILAKQQRMLQQRVEIRVNELKKERAKEKIARDVSSERSSQSPRLNESLRTVRQKHKSQQRPKSKGAERDVLRETSLGEKLNEQDTFQKEQNKEIKDQAKSEKKAQKEKVGKEVMKARKELDKAEKLQQKGQKKDELENLQKKDVTLEKEELGDMSKYNQEKNRYGKIQKDKAVVKKTTGIEITEKQIDNEKILVVEKGPTTRLEAHPSGGIDFVTRSQFNILEAAIKELSSIAVSKRLLLPGNENLLNDRMKSTASLHKTMQTLQVSERMKAAEDSIAKIIEMLTLLAAAGALPDDIVGQVETLIPITYEEANKSQPLVDKEPVAIETQASRDLNLQPFMSPDRSVVQPQPLVEESVVTHTKAVGLVETESQASRDQQPEQTVAQTRPLEEDKSIAIDTRASGPQTMESQATHDLNLQPSKSSEQTVIPSQPLVGKKSEATDTKAFKPQVAESLTSRDLNLQPSLSPEESITRPTVLSKISLSTKVPCVTDKEVRDALKDLKDDITKIQNTKTNKISAIIETAQNIVKDVGKNLNVAQNLDSRLTALHSLVEGNAEQLIGLSFEIETRMKSFSDVIAEMSQTMASGLVKLKNVNNSAETAAISAITEQCEKMETTISTVLTEYRILTETLTLLRSDMRSLLECSKMMLEEKVNRDELLDGLTYKANRLQLAGILKGVDFEDARSDFDRRLDQSHERFNQSVAIWAEVINDLKVTKNKKVDLLDLLAERDAVQKQLKDLDKKIRIVTDMLGDPKIAMTARKSDGATCGTCHEPAWMEPYDVTSGAPPRLPPLQKSPVDDVVPKEPPIPDWVKAGPSVPRHICHRWCGGSHTMAAKSTKSIQLHLQMQAIPTRKFTDYGDDGRLYMFEEVLQPCIECNALGGEETQEPVHSAKDSDTKPAETERAIECICP